MKKNIILLLIFIVLSFNLALADYFYSPMNFNNNPKNHSFELNFTGFINVTIPNNFSLISGTLTGNDSINFVIESPSLISNKSQLFKGSIFINSTKLTDYYLLYIDDKKIVDTKIEIGHGDFNYIDNNGYIGTDNTLIFNLVRIWGVGTDIFDQPARDIRFNCTFPMIVPNTVDRKYSTTYGDSEINATGNLARMEGISMFRIFVLSQEVEYPENTSYQVNCSDLYYDFDNTRVIAEIEGFNITIRNTEPLSINMQNNSEYVTYNILNEELYDLKDIELIWSIGTHTLTERLGSLESGESVSYNIQTNQSGTIDFKVRFIPEWMFNSRSPVYYEQTTFNNYSTPSYLDGLNTSSLFNNQSVLINSILETTDAYFSITTLNAPPFGGDYRVEYLFYDENNILVESVIRYITGIGDHQISFTLSIYPSQANELFDVYTIVSVLDSQGDYYEFDREFIGELNIAKLSNGGGSTTTPSYSGDNDTTTIETETTLEKITNLAILGGLDMNAYSKGNWFYIWFFILILIVLIFVFLGKKREETKDNRNYYKSV